MTAQAPKEKDELGAAERMTAKNTSYYNSAEGTASALAPRIGIDVGGVITKQNTDANDSHNAINWHHDSRCAVEGAVDSIIRIVEL